MRQDPLKCRSRIKAKAFQSLIYELNTVFSLNRRLYETGGLVHKSCPTLETPRTVACQAPLSKRFSRQEYWSGFPCPPQGDFPDPRIKPTSVMSPALVGGFFTTCAT